MSVLCAWDIVSCHSIIVTTKLIVSFFIEIISMRIKEVATRKYVEIICIILSWPVLNLLASELSDSWNLLLLRTVLRLSVANLLHSWTILLKSIGFLWRWWFSLIFKLTIRKTVLVELILINFEQIIRNSEAAIALE